ncbi:hypothetical protein HOP50_03g23980 [Chloropicon primus]|uniref:Uncharacterized protein n=2 Tax=Chloropicon primus TaxID=1764295 RepID=A0A5B8MHX0_9CHLO|nr:hypothetical protein A3770_03p23990 [Chloropicon primus]UPQ99092.1 hypothetical protein HOP50_03g23980 [Chloropicon primus]|eukprot:QDZ19881.1 hypothetical protein A3770_03p23990 [Chloropicon primus]
MEGEANNKWKKLEEVLVEDSSLRPWVRVSRFDGLRREGVEQGEGVSDPFSPSEVPLPSAQGSPAGHRRALKAKKEVVDFLLKVLLDGLRNDGAGIPNSLSASDVLHLAYGLQCQGDASDSSRGEDSFARVFSAFDKHLLHCIEREDGTPETDPKAASALVGDAHAQQWLTAARADLTVVSEGLLENYFAKSFVDTVLKHCVSEHDRSGQFSLAECSEFLVASAGAYGSYLDSFSRTLEGELGQSHQSALRETRIRLKSNISRELHPAWQKVLQSVRFQVGEKLKELVDRHVLSGQQFFQPGCLASGADDKRDDLCSVRDIARQSGLHGMVHKPFHSLLDFLLCLWEGRGCSKESCADHMLVATSFCVVSDILIRLEDAVKTKVGGHDMDFDSFVVLLNSLAMLRTVVHGMRGDTEESLGQPTSFDMSFKSLTLSQGASELVIQTSRRLCECINSYAQKFFVRPLEGTGPEMWESDKSPEEELQSVLVGFACFCNAICARASFVELPADLMDAIVEGLLEILCGGVAKLYLQAKPSASRQFRYACDAVFITELGASLASKLKESETSSTHMRSLGDLGERASSIAGPRVKCDGCLLDEGASGSSKGFEETWFVVLHRTNDLLKKLVDSQA